MTRTSNAQGLLFAEISTEEVAIQVSSVSTLKGWFGAQQIGQIKSLVTNTVNEQKGVVTHTVGDSILSSFADAESALNAALGIQRRIQKAQNPATGTIVKVRMGLAYGPVRVLAGKVSGDSVTAAGILLEKAQPNEILADQAMRDAIGSARDIRFEASGVIDGITAYRVVSLVAAPRPISEAATVPGFLASVPKATAPLPEPAEKSAPKVAAVLVKFAGAERRFGPAEGEILMGRGKDVHITVPEIHVSRKHAKIVWEQGGLPYLVNLSQNGTCVRFASTGREHTVMEKLALLEDGDLALCSRFSQASPGEIIGFRLLLG
jgi:hypothetical protein